MTKKELQADLSVAKQNAKNDAMWYRNNGCAEAITHVVKNTGGGANNFYHKRKR